MSNIELMLDALINGETIDIEPKSKVEKYLLNCIEKCGCEDLPTPTSRVDALLYKLADVISHGGGGAGYVDTKKLTNVDGLCKNGKNLEFGTDTNFDTSNVTSMIDLFHSCNTITSVPLLNTSKVTNFQSAFYGCSALTEIKTLDTTNANNLRNLFTNCTALKSIPQLDFGKAQSTENMFDNCNELTDVSFVENSLCVWLDIHWSVKLSRVSMLSILKGARLTLSGRHLKLPVYMIDGQTNTEDFIATDTELNAAYQAALAGGWIIEFISA